MATAMIGKSSWRDNFILEPGEKQKERSKVIMTIDGPKGSKGVVLKYLEKQMKDPEYFTEFKKKVDELDEIEWGIIKLPTFMDDWTTQTEERYVRLIAQRDRFDETIKKYQKRWTMAHGPRLYEIRNDNTIRNYMGVQPFQHSVMINISPDWKGVYGQNGVTDQMMVKGFKKVIEGYMNEGRWERWAYVLECGSEGDHLHAHIVAEVKPDRVKDTFGFGRPKGSKNTSHLGKGAHVPQLKKHWKANMPERYHKCFKSQGVQKTNLTNEIIRLDKLDYLIEEKKPIGHKNKKIVKNGYYSGF